MLMSSCIHFVHALIYQGKQFCCHMSSYQSSLVLFIPYNIMWILEIHHAIYSTRYLCIQLGFVVFQCRGVILRKTNTKHFSYFIRVVERNQTKACGAARLWLSLQAHSTERFQMCQPSCPLQLGQVLLILPKWRIWVGHCSDHDSCRGSTWYDMKGPRGFLLYVFCLICQYVKGGKKQISNW